MPNKKGATVTVHCSVAQGLRINRTQVHEGFMGAKTPVPIGAIVELKPGANPGIDKAWFEAWLTENKNLSVVLAGLLVAADETDPETESAEREE